MLKLHHCLSHRDKYLELVCIKKDCLKRGLICTSCYNDHQNHLTVQLSEFIAQVQQKQCTDADKTKIRQEYKSMESSAQNLLTQFQTNIQNFTQQLQQQLSKELSIVDQQREHQSEQKALLQKCQKTNGVTSQSKAVLELIDFNTDSQIFRFYDEVKQIITKNTQSAQNLSNEGFKISLDFQAYLTQLSQFLGIDDDTSISSRIGGGNIWKNNNSQLQESLLIPRNDRSGDILPLIQQQFDWQFQNQDDQQYQQFVTQGQPGQDTTFGVKLQHNQEMISLNSAKVQTQRKDNNSPEVEQVVEDLPQLPYTRTLRNDGGKNNQKQNIQQNKEDSKSKSPIKNFQSEIVRMNKFVDQRQQLKIDPFNMESKGFNSVNLNNSGLSLTSPSQKLNISLSQHYKKSGSLNKKSVSPQPTIVKQSQNFQNMSSSSINFNSRIDGDSKIQQVERESEKSDGQDNECPVLIAGKLEVEKLNLIPIRTSLIHDQSITQILVHQNNILTSSLDGKICITDLENGGKLSKFKVERGSVYNFIIFEEKNQIFIALGCNEVVLIYQKIKDQWKLMQTLKCYKSPVFNLHQVMPFNSNLFVFQQSGHCTIFNWINGQQVSMLPDENVQAATCSLVNVYQVTRKVKIRIVIGGGKSNGTINIFNADSSLNLNYESSWIAHNKPVSHLAFLRDHIVSVSQIEGQIKFWSNINFKIILLIKPDGLIIQIKEWKNQLYLSSYDRKKDKTNLTVWSLDDTKSYLQYPSFDGRGESFYLLPNKMIHGLEDGTLIVQER